MHDQHGNSVTLPPGHTVSMYAGSSSFVYVPLTLLDTRETTGRPKPSALYTSLRDSDDSSVSFRHAAYDWHRTRVLSAFARLDIDTTRQYAYAACGSNAWLMQSASNPEQFSVRSSTCHDRWCPACAKTRANIIRSNIDPLVQGQELRFITLTLKHKDEELDKRLDRLFACFASLRKTVLWKQSVTGGVAFTEVKINAQTMRWHPHVHVLCVGKYIPIERLKAAWLAVTGDSHVVDIRVVKDPKKVANYITKYVTKPADNDLYRIPAALDQAITAMKGRRLVATFGTWRSTALLRYESLEEWRPILEWPDFIERIKRKNIFCIRAWNVIRKYDFDSNDANPPSGHHELDWEP